VKHLQILALDILGGVNRNGAVAEFSRGAENTDSDLAAVGG